MDTGKSKRMLPFPDLRNKKGIAWTRQHIHRQMAAGKFPKPVHLGDQTVAWVEDEIDAWINERIAERNAAA